MSDRLPIPLHQLAQKLYNVPLLVTPDVAQTISDVLSRAITARSGSVAHSDTAIEDMQIFAPTKTSEGTAMVYAPRASRFVGSTPSDPMTGAPAPYRIAGGTAIITIVGELVNRGAWLGSSSGLISYEGIKHQCASAGRDPLVKNVIIDMRTPGGEAEGCFDCAEAIRKLAAIKPVVCFVNGLACSAGYALASACTKIVSIPEGRTGSIGVLMMHVDYSMALAAEGIKPTFVFAGTHKVDGNPYAPLPDSVRARFQEQIDATYGMFIATVMAGRPNLTDQAIRDTGALVYSGGDALAVGLIDSVGTFEDLLVELSQSDLTIDVTDGGDDQPPSDESGKTLGVVSPADTEVASATAIETEGEQMDAKTIKSKLAVALAAVGLDGVMSESAEPTAESQTPPTNTATAQTPAKAKESVAETESVAGSAATMPLHYSRQVDGQAALPPACGAPSNQGVVMSVADATCGDCLRFEIKRRDDEAIAGREAEKAKTLLSVEASADAFITTKCAHIGKDATAAYKARYIAAAIAGDTAAIADLETMAASVGPRRVERVDTSEGPDATAVAGVINSGDIHKDTLARVQALGIAQTDPKFAEAYYKERAAIMKESGVKNVATA